MTSIPIRILKEFQCNYFNMITIALSAITNTNLVCLGLRRLWIDHLTKEIYLYFDPLTIFTWTQTRQG